MSMKTRIGLGLTLVLILTLQILVAKCHGSKRDWRRVRHHSKIVLHLHASAPVRSTKAKKAKEPKKAKGFKKPKQLPVVAPKPSGGHVDIYKGEVSPEDRRNNADAEWGRGER